MRLVLDTSVIVSAVRSKTGASNEILLLALDREFELLLSVQLALEYESVLLRSGQLAASVLSSIQVESLLLSLLDVAVEIRLKAYAGPFSIDPADNHVLSLTAQGRADAIVTPGEALRLLRSKHGRNDANPTGR